jgi:hypothetical protein
MMGYHGRSTTSQLRDANVSALRLYIIYTNDTMYICKHMSTTKRNELLTELPLVLTTSAISFIKL